MADLLVDEAKLAIVKSRAQELSAAMARLEGPLASLFAALDDLVLVAKPVIGNTPTIYWQRKQQWSPILLGKATKYSIGSSGCLMCSYASCTTDAGLYMNPLQMNDWLRNNNGFLADSEGQVVNFNFARGDALGVLKFDKIGRYPEGVTTPIALIEQYVKDGGYVIVEVDFDKKTRPVEQHWVRYLGEGSMMDPWVGDIAQIVPRYKGANPGEAIYAAAFYKKA